MSVCSRSRIFGMVLKKCKRLLDGHVQHLGNVLALIAHLERLAVVALALADLAGDVNIRQEVHLDLQQAVAGAGLAAAAANVEREAPGAVAAQLGVLRGGEKAADIVKQPGIRRRVGARRAADGTLVDVDDLVQMLQHRRCRRICRDGAFGAVEPAAQAFYTVPR